MASREQKLREYSVWKRSLISKITQFLRYGPKIWTTARMNIRNTRYK